MFFRFFWITSSVILRPSIFGSTRDCGRMVFLHRRCFRGLITGILFSLNVIWTEAPCSHWRRDGILKRVSFEVDQVRALSLFTVGVSRSQALSDDSVCGW